VPESQPWISDSAAREFVDCMGKSPMSYWCWPDCSKSKVFSLGNTLQRLGYSDEELQSREIAGYLMLLHPQDMPQVTNVINDIRAGTLTGDHDMAVRLRRKDGTYSWARVSACIVAQEDSRAASVFAVTRLLGSNEDQRPYALRSSDDALHAVLDEIGNPVVLMEIDGKVLQQNAAATRIMSQDAPAHGGTPLYCPFLHETDGARSVSDFIESVASSGQRQERELWRFGRCWHVHLVPLRNKRGTVTRLLLLAQDISTFKADQEAQLAREKALTNTLVREVHHRIKNHLQGLVGLLRSSPETGRSVQEVLDTAIAKVQSIATVHGLQAEEGAAIELPRLVGSIIATLGVGSSVPVTCILEPSVAPIWSVPSEEAVPLAIAVGELLMNAVKHTPCGPGANVQARLRCAEDHVELHIRNAPAQLPEGFSISDPLRPSTGLDLVMALLPRKRAELQIVQDGDAVTTRLFLRTEKSG
jgi:two-component sensor histidine kinase/PAS domain-containing protein